MIKGKKRAWEEFRVQVRRYRKKKSQQFRCVMAPIARETFDFFGHRRKQDEFFNLKMEDNKSSRIT